HSLAISINCETCPADERVRIRVPTEQKMTKNNAAQSGENGRRDEPSLDSRYGEIGISAVASALPYQSEVKNPAPMPRPTINRTSGPRRWRPDRSARASPPASVSPLDQVSRQSARASPLRRCLRPCSLFLQDQA